MTPTGVLALLLAFQAKHLAADFLLQSGAMVRSKGIYGHPVGAAHSAVHAGLTLIVLLFLGPFSAAVATGVAAVEFVVHYHTDWAKDRLSARAGYTPKQRGYWVLVGLDQFFHHMTYVVIVFAALIAARAVPPA